MATLNWTEGCAKRKASRCASRERPAGKIERLYAAGIVAGKADLAGAVRAEVSQEQRFAGDRAAQRAHQFLAQRVAAHARVPVNVGGLVHHPAGFGIDFLPGLQAHTRHLQVVALDGVVQAGGRLRRDRPAAVAA